MCVLAAAAACGVVSSARAVILFTPDTFTDGTVQEWYGGDTVMNVDNGQGGTADRYITVATNSGGSAGSHLATHNAELRWSGDYISAGVTAVQVDMRNLGSTTLQMRLVLFGLGNRWTSNTAVTLTPGSEWQHLTFPVSQSSLAHVLGAATYTDSLSNVTQIMFRHDGGTPSSGGETINGTLGIDNPMAVPSPGLVGLLAPLGALSLRRRRA
jgi:hypothetical protein